MKLEPSSREARIDRHLESISSGKYQSIDYLCDFSFVAARRHVWIWTSSLQIPYRYICYVIQLYWTASLCSLDPSCSAGGNSWEDPRFGCVCSSSNKAHSWYMNSCHAIWYNHLAFSRNMGLPTPTLTNPSVYVRDQPRCSSPWSSSRWHNTLFTGWAHFLLVRW